MIFINQGDSPLSVRQATKRGIQHVERELGDAGARKGDQTIFGATAHADLPQRLLDVLSLLPNSPATYAVYAANWEIDNAQNAANNLFNYQLLAYQNAVERLDQYRLADGRPEETIEEPTGGVDDEGDPISIIHIIPAIEPLNAEVEQPVYSEGDMPEMIGTEMVPNPLIVSDDAERAQAQAILDNTSLAVIDYAEVN